MTPSQRGWFQDYIADETNAMIRLGMLDKVEGVVLPDGFTLRDLLTLWIARGWSLTAEGRKEARRMGLLDTPAETGAGPKYGDLSKLHRDVLRAMGRSDCAAFDEHSTAQLKEIVGRMDYSESSVKRALRWLRDNGLVLSTGTRAATRYYLSHEGAEAAVDLQANS